MPESFKMKKKSKFIRRKKTLVLKPIHLLFETYFRTKKNAPDLDTSKMLRHLRRLKDRTFPKSPQTGPEVDAVFNNEQINKKYGQTRDDFEKFYHGTVAKPNYIFSVFASPKAIRLIEEEMPIGSKRTILMDGTFKIVPTGCFNQLLVLYIEHEGYVCIFLNSYALSKYLKKSGNFFRYFHLCTS